MMVGRAVRFEIDKPEQESGDVVLKLENVSVKDHLDWRKSPTLRWMSTAARSSESPESTATGKANSSGRSPACFLSGGEIYINDRPIGNLTIRERIEAGLGYTPEDRQRYGLVADFTIAENAVLKTTITPDTREGSNPQ